MDKLRVLFVCMGNICRSPTAEGVFRAMIEEAGLSDAVEIDSAGTHGWHAGNPPDSRSVATAKVRGYDLSRQRSRRLTEDDYVVFDRLFAMDRDNLAFMRAQCPPGYEDRIQLFLELVDGIGDHEVPDPYFGEAGFERVLDLIEQASRALVEEVRRR